MKSNGSRLPGWRFGRAPRVTARRRRLAHLLPVAAVSLVAAASCSSPGKGALMLAISTDMQTPKDVDVVSVFVAVGDSVKFDYLGRVLPDGTVALPSTLAIVQPEDPTAQIHIRVIAFQEQNARVLRDVLTTAPSDRVALLRMPLDFLDDGSGLGAIPQQFVPLGVDDAPEGVTQFDPTTIGSDCDPMRYCATGSAQCQTSINGVCGNATIDSSTLPAYQATEVYGDGGQMVNGAPSSCFDVTSCLAEATPVVGLDMSTCSFTLPSAVTPPGRGGAQDSGVASQAPDASATGTTPPGFADASVPAAPPDGGSGGCASKTCFDLGYNCGQNSDGCGNTIDCGVCPTGQFCGAGGFSVCGGAQTDAAAALPDATVMAESAPVQLTGNINLAIVTSTTGDCLPSGECFVPLADDPSEGWTLMGNTVQMVPGVCKKLQNGAQLYLTQTSSCPSLQLSNPVCEPVGGSATADAASPSCDGSYVATCTPNAACGDDSGGSAAITVSGAAATLFAPMNHDSSDGGQIVPITGTVDPSTCVATFDVGPDDSGSCNTGGVITVYLTSGTTSGVPCSNGNSNGTCTQGMLSCTVARGTLDAGATGAPDATTTKNSGAPDATTTSTFDASLPTPDAAPGTPGCTADTDCDSALPYCNIATGLCEQCRNNGSACPTGGVCQNGVCVSEGEDATSAPVCGPANCNGCCDTASQCQTGMGNSACGSSGTPCANCTAMGATCASGGSCNLAAVGGDATALAACTMSAGCPASAPVCNTVVGYCVQCLADADCTGATPTCDTATNTCTP
jgi:hypothetical protein